MGRSLPSVMSHKFSQVPSADIPRSSFDRSHVLKLRLIVEILFLYMLMKRYPLILST